MSQESGPTNPPTSATTEVRPEDEGDRVLDLEDSDAFLDAIADAAASASATPRAPGAPPTSDESPVELVDEADLLDSSEEIPIDPPDEAPPSRSLAPAASAGSPTVAFTGDAMQGLDGEVAAPASAGSPTVAFAGDALLTVGDKGSGDEDDAIPVAVEDDGPASVAAAAPTPPSGPVPIAIEEAEVARANVSPRPRPATSATPAARSSATPPLPPTAAPASPRRGGASSASSASSPSSATPPALPPGLGAAPPEAAAPAAPAPSADSGPLFDSDDAIASGPVFDGSPFGDSGPVAIPSGPGSIPVSITDIEGSIDPALVEIDEVAEPAAPAASEAAPEAAPEPAEAAPPEHPIDLEVARAQREDAAARIELYERELTIETSRARAALLEHEIGDQLERFIQDESGAVKAYARSLSSDPMLRPNLWAVRRIFYRRRLWPSLLKLLDAETRYASTDQERAELWTERGQVLQDCTGELDEAVKSYQAAHRLDPGALAPLSALERVFAAQKDEVSLIEVYRALCEATQEPGRRVALLFDLARIEEAQATALGVAESEAAADESGTPLDRSLSYLHAAYEVGVDQLRVVDEIIRIAAAHGRTPDCLAALDVKAELLQLSAEQASPQRRRSLGDEVVAVRRWQAALAKEKLKDPQLVWQYLQLGNAHSPGDPLILHDLIEVAESTGRWNDLEALLGLLAERRQQAQPERPPLGLLLWRAQALRLAGRDGEAEELEHKVRLGAPVHLPFLVSRERRALRREELTALGSLYREEAEIARRGLVLRAGAAPQPDLLWATSALLRAGACYLRAGEYGAARELLEEARVPGRAAAAEAGPGALHAAALLRLITDSLEQVYERTERWADLVELYERELAEDAAQATTPEAPGRAAKAGGGARAERLHEALCELFAERLADPQRALGHNAALQRLRPEDLRLQLRAVELLRRAGDVRGEAEALRRLDEIERRVGPGARRIDGLLRRAELLMGLGEEAQATELYEEVLRYRAGDPQALPGLELLLGRAGRWADLERLLRSQVDACASAGDDAERLLALQVKLAELYEHRLGQPAQAAALFRDVLIRRPGYVPALQALARLYRRLGDFEHLSRTLELLGEALPPGQARADALLELGEVYEDGLRKPREAEDAYGRALAAAAPGLQGAKGEGADDAAVRAQASLGRLRARSLLHHPHWAPGLPEALLALAAGLPEGERARLTEERGALLSLSEAASRADGAAEPRSAQTPVGAPTPSPGEEALAAARDALRAPALLAQLASGGAAAPGGRYVPLPEIGLWRLAAARRDGKRSGAALDDLVTRLDLPGTADDAALSGLWLRAGVLGALHHDEEGERAETWRRLLRAYQLQPASPAVLAVVSDAVLGTHPAELPGEGADVLAALRALPPGPGLAEARAPEDQVALLLGEAEALLSAAARGKRDPVDARARAADCALEALRLDGRSVPALWLLRRAAAPAPGASAEALRAYALYTLRLSQELSAPPQKAALLQEAADLLRAAGDPEGAAAALRAVLDLRPADPIAFGQAYELLMARAQPPESGGAGDAGPLLELLDFRLAWRSEDEAVRAAETPLRVALLLQRAALRQAAGQVARSIEDLRALLALDGRHLVAQRRLADLLAADGQLEAALDEYERYLKLDAEPAELRAVHAQLATLLGDSDPARAAANLGHALDLGPRRLTAEEWAEGSEASLYRWQVRLLLQIGDYPEAVAVLRRLSDLIPPGPEHGIQLARVELESADVLQNQAQDPTGALIAVERALSADPLSLEALDRMVQLCTELGEADRQEKLLARAMHEARAQVAAQRPPALSGEPYHALAQIYSWQRRWDANQLAVQAECAVNGTPPRGERPHREPQRSIGTGGTGGAGGASPLGSRAFDEEARGLPLELWRELWESASRLLSPELGALGANPKERLNAKAAPPPWAPVDRLAGFFGLGEKLPYALYASREREQCQLSGMALVCGGAYAAPLAQLPVKLYARLLLRLSLLPDRLGAVVGSTGDELLLCVAAACRLADLRGPELGPALSGRLEEQARALSRYITRKEKKSLAVLAPRLDALAGAPGRARILEWQQAVRMGSARLCLALSGSVAATLDAAGVSPRDQDPQSARAAHALLVYAVSAELQDLRRELGVDGEEGKRGV